MSETTTAYQQIIGVVKDKIRRARLNAALSVNRELLLIYWEIGNAILEQQKHKGWGAKVIDRMAADLRREFPDFRGLSVRNLKYMRAFADAWPPLDNFAVSGCKIIQWRKTR